MGFQAEGQLVQKLRGGRKQGMCQAWQAALPCGRRNPGVRYPGYNDRVVSQEHQQETTCSGLVLVTAGSRQARVHRAGLGCLEWRGQRPFHTRLNMNHLEVLCHAQPILKAIDPEHLALCFVAAASWEVSAQGSSQSGVCRVSPCAKGLQPKTGKTGRNVGLSGDTRGQRVVRILIALQTLPELWLGHRNQGVYVQPHGRCNTPESWASLRLKLQGCADPQLGPVGLMGRASSLLVWFADIIPHSL